jgi:hypothetical protein
MSALAAAAGPRTLGAMGFWTLVVHRLGGVPGAATLGRRLHRISWRHCYWAAFVLLLLVYACLLLTQSTGVGRGGR